MQLLRHSYCSNRSVATQLAAFPPPFPLHSPLSFMVNVTWVQGTVSPLSLTVKFCHLLSQCVAMSLWLDRIGTMRTNEHVVGYSTQSLVASVKSNSHN